MLDRVHLLLRFSELATCVGSDRSFEQDQRTHDHARHNDRTGDDHTLTCLIAVTTRCGMKTAYDEDAVTWNIWGLSFAW